MNLSQNAFLGSIPRVTKNIIIINVIVWLCQMVLLRQGIDLTKYVGLYYVESQNFRVYQLVTYMFLHDTGSFAHVFFNMFAVFMFGRTLEYNWGAKKFLFYYFVTGIGAALMQMLVVYLRIAAVKNGMATDAVADVYANGYMLLEKGMNYSMPAKGALNLLINSVTIGASGAVFGILLAFGMLFPNAELFIIPFPFPIKAKWFVIFYGLSELFFGVANFSGDNIAHFAHLGGMIFGIILILYWKKKDKNHNRVSIY